MSCKYGLLISQYFPPDITAAAFRMGDLYYYLLDQGFEMDVLTTHPHKTASIKLDNETNNNSIKRIKLPNNSRMRQYYAFYSKGKRLAKKMGEYDFVIVSSPPMFVYSIIKKIKAKKIILDVRDIWPDSAVATGNLKKGIIYNYFKKKEKEMYLHSDEIICVSRPMSEYIESVSGKKPFVVYNGFKEEDLKKYQSLPTFQGNKSNYKIGYFGNIGLAQNMEILPKALMILKTEGIHNFNFEIIGDGINLVKLKRTSVNHNIKNYISFKKTIPREKLLRYAYENYDALFINLIKNKIFEKTIPSKLFDYLLLQKPVLSGIIGEGNEILAKTKAVVQFEQNSPQSLAKSIKFLLENYSHLAMNAKNNCQKIACDFIREKSFDIIKKIIN